MRSITLTLICTFLLFSCAKEEEHHQHEVNNQEVDFRGGDKVDLCHITGNGSWHVISVNENAVQAHLDHGDVLLEDNDGDGWVANENECVPGGDCDDNNSEVYPGSEEICGNGLDDNCDGIQDENCCPYWSLDQLLSMDLVAWFDYRNQSCVLNEVGFLSTSDCGVVGYADGSIIVDIDCNFFDWDPEGMVACDQILLTAQEILQLDNLCDDASFANKKPFEINSEN